MSQFSVKATFDGADLIKGFNDVKKEVEGLESAGEDAKKTLDQMLQDKNSTTNYKRQLSQITAELNDLAVNYARLSDAEKQSEFGQAMSQRIDELTSKAQELKGVFDDVNQSLKGGLEMPEPDVKVWDGMAELIEAAASGIQTYAGAAGLSEESTEALTRTIAKMATIQAGANTVVKIGKMLQKESNLIMAVTKVQNLAAAAAIRLKTAAEVKGKVATAAATVAQTAFNAVANANPYVLLATAIIGVGTALYGFIKSTNKAEKEQEEYNKQIEEQKEKEKERAQVVGRHVGDVISKYNLLRNEWIQLSTAEEQNEWIRNNADAFAELGLNVTTAALANKAFVDTTDDVITALRLQAEAEALRELYIQNYGKAVEKQIELEKKQEEARKKWQSGYEFTQDEFLQYNIGVGERQTTTVAESTPWWLLGLVTSEKVGPTATTELLDNKVNTTGAARIREQIVASYQSQIDAGFTDANRYLEEMNKKNEEAAAAAKKAGVVAVPSITSGGKGSTKSKSSTETKRTLQDELAALNAAMAEQDNLYEEGIISQEEYYRNKKQAAQKYIQAIIALDGDITPEQKEQIQLASQLSTTFNNQLVLLEKQRKLQEDKTKNMNEFATTAGRVQQLEEDGILSATEAREQQIAAAKKYYNFLTANWENLTDQEKETAKSIKATIDAFESAKTTVPRGRSVEYRETKVTETNEILAKFDAGVITRDVAQKAIDDINADLESLALKPIPIDLDLEHFNTQMDQAMQMFDAFGSLGSVVSNINSVYESFKNLDASLDEAKNGWEEFMVGFDLGMQIMNGVVGIMETINTIMETATMIQEISAAVKLKDAAASGTKAGADTAAATAATSLATADTAAAAATGTKAATDIADAAASGTKAAADTAAATASTAVATADSAAAAATGTKAATDIAGATAAGTKAAADMAAAGAATTEATANTAAAASGAAKAVSWLPIVGPILAIAAIAAVVGGLMAVKSKGKFASGGIVPGPSKIGDFNIARVNGGEMILNTRQQANLFNMLDHNRIDNQSMSPQNVSFRIQGDSLVGVIDNYNKKRGRL